jgi:hypothetical protein
MTSLSDLKQRPSVPVIPGYQHYTQALETQSQPPTGFMEFQPRDPAKQAKYSAMSATWEGEASSEAAIARGDYDLDRAEKNREDLRAKKPQPKLQMPSAPEWNCSIQ